MNILFVSHLGADRAAGLCWSVPAGVSAQQSYDNCLWINTRSVELDHWRAVSAFHRLEEFGKELSLDILPDGFNPPDLVVFEGFYHPEAVRFSWQLRRRKAPYIIIPRGSLTKQAFHNHSYLNYLKKKIAELLLLKNYTRHALALQFLTNKEYQDSGNSWNKNNFIIPNGIGIPEVGKTEFSENQIKGVFIGRPSLLHKGLDLLIDACCSIQDEMRAFSFTIDCYMPRKNDYDQVVSQINTKKITDLLIVKPAVFNQEKETALLNSDVFIMTSRFEGHPMGLIEAMSYGLPVAITPGTNMAEEVLSKDAGWVSECSVFGVSKMLRTIIDEKSLFANKGRNARTLSRAYEWDSIARQSHEYYEMYLKNVSHSKIK